MKFESNGVAETVHGEPPGSRVPKQDQGHDDTVDQQWDREFLIGDSQSVMKRKIGRHGGQRHESIVDIRRAQKVTRRPFIFKRTDRAPFVHRKKILEKASCAASGTS